MNSMDYEALIASKAEIYEPSRPSWSDSRDNGDDKCSSAAGSSEMTGPCNVQLSSTSPGSGAHKAQYPAPWIDCMLSSQFFVPCEAHKNHKKNECTFFCTTCPAAGQALCQHCMVEHQGHQTIQIRRYVYCDVVRTVDISPHMDTTGVQCYIINQAKVAFLNPRLQAKVGLSSSPDVCTTCHRHLREGFAFCSLACKVEALRKGTGEDCRNMTSSDLSCDAEEDFMDTVDHTSVPSKRQRVFASPSPGAAALAKASSGSDSQDEEAFHLSLSPRSSCSCRNPCSRRKQVLPRQSPVA